MNWEAIGAIAETIASVCVVISLMYLGVQIRNQMAETKLANTPLSPAGPHRGLPQNYRVSPGQVVMERRI